MRKGLKNLIILAGIGSATLGVSANAATFESSKISFRNISGAVEIVTTSGNEIDISIEQGMTYQPIKVYEEDGVVIIEGEKERDLYDDDCCNKRIRREVHLRKDRTVQTGEPVDEDYFRNYPKYIVAMPFRGDAEFIDARILLDMDRLNGLLSLDACYVYGETSDVDEAIVGVIHGSRLVMGNIASGIELDVSGDADVMAGNAAMADIDIAGPGDVILGAIDGMMDVSIAGSGDVRAQRLDGPLTARIAGSGTVQINEGEINRLRATIDGSGSVRTNGEAVQPDLRLSGSAEIHMRTVTGRITRQGRGVVFVDGEEVTK